MSTLPTAKDVLSAAKAIHGEVLRTPTTKSQTLSQICDADIHLKFENLQFTASFKERGALWKLKNLSDEERARGVIAMSRGNHAQGVAYHAQRQGVPATIVMPVTTPTVKVAHTEKFGARVVLEGETLVAAGAKADSIAAAEGLIRIHPYDDPYIIAGQGTLGLEMMEDAPDLDVLVVPIGGGGLISGVALGAKHVNPNVEIVGVQAEMFPSMYNAFHHQTLECGGPTIAEGIAVSEPGGLTQQIVNDQVADILLTSERHIEQAIAMLLNVEKTVAEGAGAAGLAAVLQYPETFRGKKIGIVLCGGNIDSRLLASVLLRELARDGRMLSIRVESQDRPGFLGQITTAIGQAGGNIIDVSHNRLLTDLPAKSADIGFAIETRDSSHADDIFNMLRRLGMNVRRVAHF